MYQTYKQIQQFDNLMTTTYSEETLPQWCSSIENAAPERYMAELVPNKLCSECFCFTL